MLVLVAEEGGGTELTTDRLGRLSRLGVTDISVHRDDTTIAVVLHGWAFDPERSGDQVAGIVSGGRVARPFSPFCTPWSCPTAGEEVAMRRTAGRRLMALGASVGCALGATLPVTGASAETGLPPTWHVHDCVTAPCVLPHAPVAFFPHVLGETLDSYLADPAACPDATDKAFLGGGQPPTSDGVAANQPLREGVCMTSDTVIHLASISPTAPAPAGWTSLGPSGGYTTYYLVTAR